MMIKSPIVMMNENPPPSTVTTTNPTTSETNHQNSHWLTSISKKDDKFPLTDDTTKPLIIKSSTMVKSPSPPSLTSAPSNKTITSDQFKNCALRPPSMTIAKINKANNSSITILPNVTTPPPSSSPTLVKTNLSMMKLNPIIDSKATKTDLPSETTSVIAPPPFSSSSSTSSFASSSSTTTTLPTITTTPSSVTANPITSFSSSTTTTPSTTTSSSTVTLTASTTNQGENTGRWTAEEHLLFLQGLEQFGKGWKNIASLIKSRTVVQIRTHAQKYFQKLAKANPDNIDTSTTTSSTIKKRRNSEESSTTLLPGIQTSAHPQSNNVGTHTNGQNKTKRRKTMHELPIPLPPSHPKATTTVPATIAPFVLSTTIKDTHTTSNLTFPTIYNSHGSISDVALEDSLFRFRTPVPALTSISSASSSSSSSSSLSSSNISHNSITLSSSQHYLSARKEGPSITLPSEYPIVFSTLGEGEISPVSVMDTTISPPSWAVSENNNYHHLKNLDWDNLLDVSDSLQWLTDNGDLHETYEPVVTTNDPKNSVIFNTPPHSPVTVTTSSRSSYTKSSANSPGETEDNIPEKYDEDDSHLSQFHDTLVDDITDLSLPFENDYVPKRLRVESSMPTSMMEVEGDDTVNDHLDGFYPSLDDEAFVSVLLMDDETTGTDTLMYL